MQQHDALYKQQEGDMPPERGDGKAGNTRTQDELEGQDSGPFIHQMSNSAPS